jgi:hypothetical protein
LVRSTQVWLLAYFDELPADLGFKNELFWPGISLGNFGRGCSPLVEILHIDCLRGYSTPGGKVDAPPWEK